MHFLDIQRLFLLQKVQWWGTGSLLTAALFVDIHVVEVLCHLIVIVQTSHVLAVVIGRLWMTNTALVGLALIMIWFMCILLHPKRLFLKAHFRK